MSTLSPVILVLGGLLLSPPALAEVRSAEEATEQHDGSGLKDLPAAPLGRVSDFARVLPQRARAALEAQLAAYERMAPQEGGAPQIVVVILPSLRGDPIEDVAIRLGERWKIGSKADDGVILVWAPRERKLRIEVGYGAEGRIPDALARRIIAEIIAPRFRKGDYEGGLRAGVAAIHQALSGKAVTGVDELSGRPAPPRQPGAERTPTGFFGGGVLLLLLLLLLFGGRGGRGFLFGMLLGSLFGSRGPRGGSFGGGGGGFGGGGASGDY